MYGSFKLRDQETQLEWILFHDVLVTSKVYVKTVCPVRYRWVKDLLPRLHKIDAYELSSVAREEVTEEEMAKWRTKEDLKRENGEQIGLGFPCCQSFPNLGLGDNTVLWCERTTVIPRKTNGSRNEKLASVLLFFW